MRQEIITLIPDEAMMNDMLLILNHMIGISNSITIKSSCLRIPLRIIRGSGTGSN